MKILILDDENYRIEMFKKYLLSSTLENGEYIKIDAVKTVQECKEKLIDNEYNFLTLDHDLGGQINVDSGREDCGMEIVRFLEKYKKNFNRIFIHTCNEPARKLMMAKLMDAGYNVVDAPFVYIDWENLLKNLVR